MDKEKLSLLQNMALTYAGALLTYASGNLFSGKYPLLFFSLPFYFLQLLSFLFLLIGMVLTVVLFLPKKKSIRERMARMKIKRVPKNRLNDLYKLISQYSGGSLVPEERRAYIYDRCKDYFIMIKEGDKIDIISKPLGLLVIYPLNKAGVDFLKEKNNFGGQIKDRHIAKRNPKGCHIAFIWGEDKASRAKIIKVMDQRIDNWCKNASSFLVFARPATNEALKVLKKRKYQARELNKDGLGDVFSKELVQSK